jgi:hypothetical protein
MACNVSSTIGKARLSHRAVRSSASVNRVRANRSRQSLAPAAALKDQPTSANTSSLWEEGEEEEELLDLHRKAATLTHRSRVTFGLVGWIALLQELFSNSADV